MFETLAKEMNYKGVIKLHPSFNVPESKSKEIRSLFESMSFKNLTLSPNNCIVELEMFYEKTNLWPTKFSFNLLKSIWSSFKNINLY